MAVFHPADFVHPADRSAKEHLEAIPLLQTLVKAYMKIKSERADRFLLVTEGVRLGPRHLPEIYQLLPPDLRRLRHPRTELSTIRYWRPGCRRYSNGRRPWSSVAYSRRPNLSGRPLCEPDAAN